MAISRRTGRTGRSRLTLAICVLISLVALTLNYRGSGVVDGVRGGALDLIGPLRDGADRVTRPVTDAWHGITGYDDLEAENAQLRAQVDELRRQLLENEGEAQRYQELVDLLDVSRLGDLDVVAARVVSPAPSNFDLSVEIDRGTADGVREGHPVVAGGGLLVGTVVQAGRSRSMVRLLTDPSFRAGVVLPSTGAIATVHGHGRGDQPTLEHLAATVEVNEGDVVKTSGARGSQYPPDLIVGRVSAVDRAPGAVELGVRVEPAAEVEQVTYVQVVRWTPSS